MYIDIRRKEGGGGWFNETSKQVDLKFLTQTDGKVFPSKRVFWKIFFSLKCCAIPPPLPSFPAWMHKCNLMSSYRVPFRTFFHVLKLTWFLSFRQRFRKKESSLYKVIQPRTGKIRGGNLGKCNFSSLRNSFGRKRIFFFFHERMKFWYIPTLCWHFLLIFRDCIICNLPSPMEILCVERLLALSHRLFTCCEVVS